MDEGEIWQLGRVLTIIWKQTSPYETRQLQFAVFESNNKAKIARFHYSHKHSRWLSVQPSPRNAQQRLRWRYIYRQERYTHIRKKTTMILSLLTLLIGLIYRTPFIRSIKLAPPIAPLILASSFQVSLESPATRALQTSPETHSQE